MGSKPSKAGRPTPVETEMVIPAETETVVVPRIPREIIDEILDYLTADSGPISLRSCALISKSWVPSCQRRLFHTIHFTPDATIRWSRTFLLPEESPAHHVKDLRASIDGSDRLFFKYTPWFTNLERMTLLGDGEWTPTRWSLPQSITSLTIRTDTSSLVQVRNIMAQLPNLNDLSLSGALVPLSRRALTRIGTGLRGRFGGQLRLFEGYAGKDVVDMLLEVPTGLHFTEVQICGTCEGLLPAVRLAEACCKTLVKLSHAVTSHYDREAFEQSFDFSKFPNLQTVEFRVRWMGGSLVFIPRALSTIKPATSPRLSIIQLNFSRPVFSNRSANALIEDAGDDLRSVAGEISRIEGELEGAVNLNVVWGQSFREALGALNIFQH